jgi:hypothetical protein
MGKGEGRRARPSSYAANNYRPGIERKTIMIEVLVDSLTISVQSTGAKERANLALADNAFQGVTDIDQLLLPLDNKDSLLLAYKEDMLDKPVFKSP